MHWAEALSYCSWIDACVREVVTAPSAPPAIASLAAPMADPDPRPIAAPSPAPSAVVSAASPGPRNFASCAWSFATACSANCRLVAWSFATASSDLLGPSITWTVGPMVTAYSPQRRAPRPEQHTWPYHAASLQNSPPLKGCFIATAWPI